MQQNSNIKNIVYFDGVCNLCNGFIDWLVTHDHNCKFHIASLQGQTAKIRLPENFQESMNSVILEKNGNFYSESTAVLLILKELSFPYKLIYDLFILVPKFLRDFVYKQIAKNRYFLFGKKESCRVPSEQEKEKFLT